MENVYIQHLNPMMMGLPVACFDMGASAEKVFEYQTGLNYKQNR